MHGDHLFHCRLFFFYFCCFNGIPRLVTSHNTFQKAELFFSSFKVYADFGCFNFWLHIRTSGTTWCTHFSWSNLWSEPCWLIMSIILATRELLNSHHCTQTSVNFQCFHWFLWVVDWIKDHCAHHFDHPGNFNAINMKAQETVFSPSTCPHAHTPHIFVGFG